LDIRRIHLKIAHGILLDVVLNRGTLVGESTICKSPHQAVVGDGARTGGARLGKGGGVARVRKTKRTIGHERGA